MIYETYDQIYDDFLNQTVENGLIKFYEKLGRYSAEYGEKHEIIIPVTIRDVPIDDYIKSQTGATEETMRIYRTEPYYYMGMIEAPGKYVKKEGYGKPIFKPDCEFKQFFPFKDKIPDFKGYKIPAFSRIVRNNIPGSSRGFWFDFHTANEYCDINYSERASGRCATEDDILLSIEAFTDYKVKHSFIDEYWSNKMEEIVDERKKTYYSEK